MATSKSDVRLDDKGLVSCDFEETYVQHKAEILKEAPRSTALLRIPDDDIVVEARPQLLRPEFAIPKDAAVLKTVHAPARDVLHLLADTERTKQPARKYEHLTRYPTVDVAATLAASTAHELKYDIDVLQADDATATMTRPNVKNLFPDSEDRRRSHIVDMQFDAAVVENNLTAKLSAGKDYEVDFDKVPRTPLASLFSSDEPAVADVGIDDAGRRRRIQVTVDEVQWQGALQTRLSGALVLYDCIAKRRISESAPLTFTPGEADAKARRTCAVFDISNPNPDIVLFVRVEKPFSGDVGAWLDAYGKEKQKAAQVETGRDIMQPFGWTCVHIFSADLLGEVAEEAKETVDTDWLYRYDEARLSDGDIIGACASLKSKQSKKNKTIPVKLSLTLQELITPGSYSGSSSWMTEIPPFNAAYAPSSMASIRAVHTCFCWPQSLNIQKGSAGWKNIAIKCQLATTDEPNNQDRFVKCFVDADGTRRDSISLSVNYHNRSPVFNEEIKIALPLSLPSGSHLFFTFTHISFKHKREDEIAGYSFLPLINRNVFVADGEKSLAFATNLPAGYLKEDASCKWVDGGKQIFTLSLMLSSCLFPQDPKLGMFFDSCNNSQVSENDLAQAIRNASEADPFALAKFFAVTVDQLLALLCTATPIIRKKAFRSLISVIATVSTEKGKAPVVVWYMRDLFMRKAQWTLKLHEELVSNWISLIEEKDPCCRDLVRHSWAIFEMIWKSCILDRTLIGRADITARKQAFKAEFIISLSRLLDELSAEVYKLAKGGLNIGNTLNESMAKFLVNALTVLPVGTVFHKIRDHSHGFDDTVAVHVYMKFDFLQIICGYEHSVALSLPVRSLLNLEKLVTFWSTCKRFFFPALLLDHVVRSFKLSTEKARHKALNCLQSVLAKTECDQRFTTFDRHLVFTMYLPFIAAACDHIEICDISANEVSAQGERRFSVAERRTILACVTFILRYMDMKQLAKWVEKENGTRALAFYKLLTLVPSAFEYLGKKTIEEMWTKGLTTMPKSSAEDAKKYIENAYKAQNQGGNLRELRGTLRAQGAGTARASKFNTATNGNSLSTKNSSSIRSEEAVQEARWAALHAHEATIAVAHVLYTFCDSLKSHLFAGPFENLESLMSTVESLLSIPQNSIAVNVCVRVLANYLKIYSTLLLKGNRICSELCWSLLRAGSSPFNDCRAYVADCIYIMLRLNFTETKKHFGKVKTQLTVALSKNDCPNPANLKMTLMLVTKFANSDALQTNAFHKMCADGVCALVEILKNNIKMNNHRDDPEMLQDMYYALAKSYSGAPDLRLTVLDTLASLHVKTLNFAEAGFCILNCAALVGEYLKFKGIDYGTTMGSTQFTACSPNIAEDTFFRSDVNPELEGNCQSTSFSEYGYLDLIDKAANLFTKGSLYETAVESYKLMLPIHEKRKNYNQLIRIHGCIKASYEDIVNTMGKRILATFFRVDFYGTRFGELNGQSFIYKERSVTQLSEIVTRLTDMYRTKYGEDFELINDSTNADKSKHHPEKVYLGIAFCEPYFTAEELKKKTTYFEKMNGVTKFFYEQPYTMTPGKAHGDVDQQYKRKIIMTTSKPFPYVRKRLQIAATTVVELTPIEVAIEAIADRCEKLRVVVEADPLNLKNLQLLLQGSVRAQVNKGPLEFASIFLDKQKKAKYSDEKVKVLRTKLQLMIELCAQALRISKMHAPADQADYNEDLEEGFTYLRLKLEAYVADIGSTPNSPGIVDGTAKGQDPSRLLDNFLKS